MTQPHIVIDARNLLYRAHYSNKNNGNSTTHDVTAAFRFIHQWVGEFKPKSVSVFWDSSGDLWRCKLIDGYKDRDRGAHDGARAALKVMEPICRELFNVIGVFQFLKDTQEADDLIYAACRVLAPEPVIIISSDNDYGQVAFRMPHVKLYDPMKKIYKSYDFDPAIMKALMGDESDKIDGYYNVGKVKSEKMARSITERCAFLAREGYAKFLRNMLLIDLSLCPKLLANIVYVQEQYARQVPYDSDAAMDVARRYGLKCLLAEYSRTVSPFKAISENSQVL